MPFPLWGGVAGKACEGIWRPSGALRRASFPVRVAQGGERNAPRNAPWSGASVDTGRFTGRFPALDRLAARLRSGAIGFKAG